jgi:LytS/YehU family sensor histidine kinase
LLENAVKHGVNTMLTSCKVKLTATCHETALFISISNKFDPDAVPRKGTGTGLGNVQKRMAAIYGRNDLFTSKATNNVFEVKLQIPVQKAVNQE